MFDGTTLSKINSCFAKITSSNHDYASSLAYRGFIWIPKCTIHVCIDFEINFSSIICKGEYYTKEKSDLILFVLMGTMKWGLEAGTHNAQLQSTTAEGSLRSDFTGCSRTRDSWGFLTRVFPHHHMPSLSSRSWYWKIYERVGSSNDMMHCEFNCTKLIEYYKI